MYKEDNKNENVGNLIYECINDRLEIQEQSISNEESIPSYYLCCGEIDEDDIEEHLYEYFEEKGIDRDSIELSIDVNWTEFWDFTEFKIEWNWIEDTDTETD